MTEVSPCVPDYCGQAMTDVSPCVPDYCGQAMNDDSPTAASLLPLPGHRRRCAAASAAQCAAAAFTAAIDAFAALPSTLPPPQPPPSCLLSHTHTHTAALALALARKASLYSLALVACNTRPTRTLARSLVTPPSAGSTSELCPPSLSSHFRPHTCA